MPTYEYLKSQEPPALPQVHPLLMSYLCIYIWMSLIIVGIWILTLDQEFKGQNFSRRRSGYTAAATWCSEGYNSLNRLQITHWIRDWLQKLHQDATRVATVRTVLFLASSGLSTNSINMSEILSDRDVATPRSPTVRGHIDLTILTPRCRPSSCRHPIKQSNNNHDL